MARSQGLPRAPKGGTTAVDTYVRKSLLFAGVGQGSSGQEAVLTLDLKLPLMELFTDGYVKCSLHSTKAF